MTRKEAVGIIKADCIDGKEKEVWNIFPEVEEALNMSIKSLEAWDKVQKEIVDKSGTWGDLWTVEAIINVINRHLKEVE